MKESFYLLSQTLNKNHDDSAKKIEERWLQNSICKFLFINHILHNLNNFLFLDLLEEYLMWLPQTAHKEIKLVWPPL